MVDTTFKEDSRPNYFRFFLATNFGTNLGVAVARRSGGFLAITLLATILTIIFCDIVLKWNESSQDTSGASSHGHKMNFSKIPAMVCIFFWFRGLLKTLIFFLASEVGDEKSVKWP